MEGETMIELRFLRSIEGKVLERRKAFKTVTGYLNRSNSQVQLEVETECL